MAQERSWAFGLFFPLQPWTFLGVFWEGGDDSQMQESYF